MKKPLHKIDIGTVFTGRVNGVQMKVVGIESDRFMGKERNVAVCRDLKTGKRHKIALDLLRRYEIEIER